ncbi:MAG: DUF1549 and DUF1553 domain-containing protein [Gemmataceae bacterium]
MRIRLLSLLALAMLLAPVSAEEAWWSFRPLVKPKPPVNRNPIDGFILAKLAERGLAMSPEADRRTLIRRVTYDLTGLPPTFAEVQAFRKDPSENAYEKLVDRLLASPAYGERMARIWMDLAHFAETHGHDQDRVRPHAWRYRDYLIQSLNADVPYGRFVQEQIAADALFPEKPELVPALGFLAAGPWDESSLRDIREDSIDREIGRYLDRDDMLTTVFNTFQGLTVQCARCHDHKFDPISQLDYYKLQAVFAGVGRGNISFDPDPAAAKKRSELKAELAALEKGEVKLDPKLIAEWEARHTGEGVVWQVLDFAKLESTGGSTLAKQADFSVRSEAKRPEKDSYLATVKVKAKGITAVRLEVLADDTLPMKGPGRQDNGNLHLSEFGLVANGKPVPLRTPTADFNQDGWTIAHALDGNPATAWGIYPQVGKSHEAVFELKEPLAGENELVFKLDQLHGGGHLIGRFRLSITEAAPPVKVGALPAAIRDALAVPAEKRTPQQTRELASFIRKEQLTAAIEALPAPATVYAAGSNFAADGSHRPSPVPRPVRMLKRGNIRTPGDLVEPGPLALLPGMPDQFELPANHTEGARRAALAKWIADLKNPLTWRTIVNRVWQMHFGRGLVGTPSDFGKMGGAASHPELLDWLAAEFRDGGQSLKKLHKRIVMSDAYRQSSIAERGVRNVESKSRLFGIVIPRSAFRNPSSIDAENRLLWRGPRMRLDAEQVRDSILIVSERLDPTRGGPSDQQFGMRPGIHVTPVVEYGTFDWDRPQGHRRSVYRFVFRTLPDPLVDCLDGADASTLTPKRNESVTAPQALSLMNNEFILVHAKAFAAAVEKHTPDRSKQISTACERVWGRPPTDAEAQAFADYAAKHGLANLCRVLFNSNEFLYLD